jgi:hypothetical protein
VEFNVRFKTCFEIYGRGTATARGAACASARFRIWWHQQRWHRNTYGKLEFAIATRNDQLRERIGETLIAIDE